MSNRLVLSLILLIIIIYFSRVVSSSRPKISARDFFAKGAWPLEVARWPFSVFLGDRILWCNYVRA